MGLLSKVLSSTRIHFISLSLIKSNISNIQLIWIAFFFLSSLCMIQHFNASSAICTRGISYAFLVDAISFRSLIQKAFGRFTTLLISHDQVEKRHLKLVFIHLYHLWKVINWKRQRFFLQKIYRKNLYIHC